MDSIIGILNYLSDEIEKEFNEENVSTLAKIICLIKCEIHKDKDVVFLDILIDLFSKHLQFYRKYEKQVDQFPNILNCYVQFLFELLEAMFFYFL